MPNKTVWLIVLCVLIALMLFGNKKVRVYKVFLNQLKVFKNAKTGRLSVWDFSCFLLMPIGISAIVSFIFQTKINESLAVTLTTVFSLIFTILFGFATIILGKLNSPHSIERQVVSETFISIISASLLSLLAAIISTLVIMVNEVQIVELLSFVVFSLSFIIIMLILLIIKRTFVIYCDSQDK